MATTKKTPARRQSVSKKKSPSVRKSPRANAGFEKKKVLLGGGIAALVLMAGFTGFAISQSRKADAAEGVAGYPIIANDANVSYLGCKYPRDNDSTVGIQVNGKYDKTTTFSMTARATGGSSGYDSDVMGHVRTAIVVVHSKTGNITINYTINVLNKGKFVRTMSGSRTFPLANIPKCTAIG